MQPDGFKSGKGRSFTRAAVRVAAVLAVIAAIAWWGVPRINFSGARPAMVLDSLDGVYVYNKGPVGKVHGRNLSETGYNIGLKYQCVEFVKRYYLYRYGHQMPDSYGHAKDFFDGSLPDGALNAARGLIQYTNGSTVAPTMGDLIVFAPTVFNPYGHVAIVCASGRDSIEIIQQNPGRASRTRESLPLSGDSGTFTIEKGRVLGWLRLPGEQ